VDTFDYYGGHAPRAVGFYGPWESLLVGSYTPNTPVGITARWIVRIRLNQSSSANGMEAVVPAGQADTINVAETICTGATPRTARAGHTGRC